MRAIGNLSFSDENIKFIVEQGATHEIVSSMDAHKKDLELQQLGIDGESARPTHSG